MKTDYEYIRFVVIPAAGKTSQWTCQNIRHGETLGKVAWNGAWRQYCYESWGQAVYSAGCLRDIADFIRQLMEARKT